MAHVTVAAGVEELTVQARIIRADGTVEQLGTVAHYRRPRRLARLRGLVASLRKA